MRELLLALLKDQKRLTGIRQYEEIASNPNGKEAAQFELDALLKEMIDVCNQYSYISDEDKFKIIKARMTDAPEYYGLNARFVRLALERVKDIYFRESGYIETNALLNAKESNAVPLEECSPEIQAMVKQYTSLLAAGTIKSVPKVNDHNMKVIQSEDEERIKKEAKSQGYDWQAANEKYLAQKARLKASIESRGLDKLTGMEGLKSFEIEGIAVWGRNKEEAMEIYLEVYI